MIGNSIRVGLLVLVLVASGCNVGSLSRLEPAPAGPVATLPPEAAQDIKLAEAQEVDLVETLVRHRTAYHQSLQNLRAFYESRGYHTKQTWAEFELERLRAVKPFRYLMDAEVPAEALHATDVIPEANERFAAAQQRLREAGHGIPGVYNQTTMIEVAEDLRQLIQDYPSSDKIDDAAFLLGEIHREYFDDQDLLAVTWYERAWTWDPNTPYPARFEAAKVYDFRLHDRARALELYREVVQHETAYGAHTRFATQRIHALTDGAESPAEQG
jgi:hypothetical protein